MRVFLIGDGGSDQVLRFPCQWLLKQLDCPSDVLFLPEPSGSRPLEIKLAEAMKNEPDLLLVHRDAEKEPWKHRRAEIEKALRSVVSAQERTVAIIPVRMTEAWFLIDEPALRKASGNPNGKTPLHMPSLQSLEKLVDAKDELYKRFGLAAATSGRQQRSIRQSQCYYRLAELISDFSPLRRLSAFQELEAELKRFLAGFQAT